MMTFYNKLKNNIINYIIFNYNKYNCSNLEDRYIIIKNEISKSFNNTEDNYDIEILEISDYNISIFIESNIIDIDIKKVKIKSRYQKLKHILK